MNSSPMQNQNANSTSNRVWIFSAVLAVAAVVVYVMGVKPAGESLDAMRKQHNQLKDQKSKVDFDLYNAKRVKDNILTLDASLKPYVDSMLRPLLESWSMRAKSILDVYAAEVGLSNVDYSEMQVRALPLPKMLPKQLYARRPIKASCRGSYAEIVSFIMRVERELPYVTVQSFQIEAQNTPDIQKAEIVFEWLCKGAVTATEQKGPKK